MIPEEKTVKKILITAFEPFGGSVVNTSAAVLEMLPEEIGGAKVEKVLLPVVFGKAAEKALACTADCIFLLGEAAGRTAVTPERRGRNVRNARIPDNEGNKPEGEKILADGPEEYLTVFPVDAIVEEMKAEGYGIEVSEDAGTYVCNDTFYLTGVKSAVPVQFIHVPGEREKANLFCTIVERFIGKCLESIFQ